MECFPRKSGRTDGPLRLIAKQPVKHAGKNSGDLSESTKHLSNESRHQVTSISRSVYMSLATRCPYYMFIRHLYCLFWPAYDQLKREETLSTARGLQTQEKMPSLAEARQGVEPRPAATGSNFVEIAALFSTHHWWWNLQVCITVSHQHQPRDPGRFASAGLSSRTLIRSTEYSSPYDHCSYS